MIESESKCQISKVSFKNLTAVLVNVAEGQGQPFNLEYSQVYQVLHIISLFHIQSKVAKSLED